MSTVKKVLSVLGVLLFIGGLGVKITKLTKDSTVEENKYALQIVEKIKKEKWGEGKAFSAFDVTKDQNGSGILLNYTLQPEYVDGFTQISQEQLRRDVIKMFGWGVLDRLMKNHIYFIFSFKDAEQRLIKKVIISPSNH